MRTELPELPCDSSFESYHKVVDIGRKRKESFIFAELSESLSHTFQFAVVVSLILRIFEKKQMIESQYLLI